MQVKVFNFPSTVLLWKALSNEIHHFKSNNFLLSILCIYTLDENISQYYFQIAKIDIVLQSSEFCMIF